MTDRKKPTAPDRTSGWLLRLLLLSCLASPNVVPCLLVTGCGSGQIGDTNDNNNTNPDAGPGEDGTANNNNDGDVPETCGNGVTEGEEQCDDGSGNSNTEPDACRTDCTLPSCGDQVVDGQYGEVCDDGNHSDGDGCSADCTRSVSVAGFGFDAVAYDIARDNADRVHMIWKVAGNQPLQYGLVTGCQLAGQPEEIPQSTSMRTRGFRPRMAVKPDGTFVHVSWSDPVMTELYHAWFDGSAWHRETLFAAPGGMITAQPVSGVDMQGQVHIIALYQESTSPFSGRILYWRMLPDQDFIEDGSVLYGPDAGVDWRSTAMFTTLAGDIHAVWKAPARTGRYTYVESGGTLMNRQVIDIPAAPSSNHTGMGDLFVTESGDVHAVCTDYDGTDQGIWRALKPSGAQNFDEPTVAVVNPFYDNGGTLGFDPWSAVAVDPSGRVLVSWGENPSGENVVSKVYLSIGENGVFTPGLWDDDADIHQYSKTAMTATSDSTYLVWRTAGANGSELRCAILRFAP